MSFTGSSMPKRAKVREVPVLKHPSFRLAAALLALLVVGFSLLGSALAQEGSPGEGQTIKGPCEGLRTVDTTLIRFGAPWQCADLRGVDLSGLTMMDAFFSWSDVSGAVLEGANFYYGDFTGANFTGANLFGANLGRTRLVLTDFTGANLEGADLTGAILLRTIFTGATYNRATRWPVGFDPVANGAIRVD